ncbi:ABC transporter permease subunit [Streptomyces sp. NPDC020141]|uniref:ABC transporter permease subunit n=1 Tax=Streptomyces sp. NPDC020141 TaxID=3365065 RepID=UPI0037B66F42
MSATVFVRHLADSRRGLAGWAVGTALTAMAYAGTYPSQRANTDSIPQALRDGLHIDATAAGYLNASVFGILLPVLAMIYGVMTGTRALAGDEESGRLDLFLAHPLTRTRLALERFAALATGAFAIAGLVWLGLLTVRTSAELTTVTPTELLAQCLNLALLAVFFGALALGLGAALGRRTTVLVATAVTGVIAYMAGTFATQLGADWLTALSPFHYYIGGEPLRNGFQWGDATVLALASAALVAAGLHRFNRRDIDT